MAKETMEKKPFFDIGFLCKNTLLCFLATGILLLLGAVLATYLSMTEPMTEILVIVLTAGCVFYGGFRMAKHTGRQGLIQGGISGLFYMACLTLAGMLIYGEWSIKGTAWLSILIGILCGAIGGMLGVNTKPKRKR